MFRSIVPVCMMGVAFSLIPAVMWPSVAYIVDQNRLGTAYALMTLIQQIGFFILNLLIGKANDYAHAGLDNPGGYGLGMWIFSVLGFVGLDLRHSVADSRNRSAGAWAGDDHGKGVGGSCSADTPVRANAATVPTRGQECPRYTSQVTKVICSLDWSAYFGRHRSSGKLRFLVF